MAGLLPVLIIIVYFKTRLAPANDLFFSEAFRFWGARLADPSRYIQVGQAFWKELIRFGGGVINIFPLLFFYPLLLKVRVIKEDRLNIIASLAVLLIMSAGYFCVFLITPRDLSWHLKTSLSRLLVQLWPSFVFTYFMIVSTPEEALLKPALLKVRK